MAKNPRARRTEPATKGNEPDGAAGQFGVDDRGNMTWQWRDDEDLLAEDAVGRYQRMQALVSPGMEVVDEEPGAPRPRQLGSKAPGTGRPGTGYNPYNSGPQVRRSARKKKDLRKFSEWVALRNKLEGKGRKK